MFTERLVLGAGPFRPEQNVVGTDDRRHRARHTVRRVVPHAADRPPDGQGGRRRAYDVPVVRGRRRGRGRRAVHEAQPTTTAGGQGAAQAEEALRRRAGAERDRSAGGQVGGHSRWQTASRPQPGRVNGRPKRARTTVRRRPFAAAAARDKRDGRAAAGRRRHLARRRAADARINRPPPSDDFSRRGTRRTTTAAQRRACRRPTDEHVSLSTTDRK